MNDKDISRYCDVMEEVKRRTTVVQSFLRGEWHSVYRATTIESACLQIRKMLELIAMASLVVNRKEFQRINVEFAKCWNARLILQDIERLNPDFYPRPINDVNGKLVNIQSGFLTRKKFPKVYEKCGAMLHAENPFGSKCDYGYYEKSIGQWLSEIMRLLNNHIIRLLDDPNLYVVHMKEDRDNKVHAYTFAPVETRKANNDLNPTDDPRGRGPSSG